MTSVEERYNKIINNINNKQEKMQSVTERYNKIVNNINDRGIQYIPSQTKKTRNMSLMDKINERINTNINPTRIEEYKILRQQRQEEQRKKEQEENRLKTQEFGNTYNKINNLTDEQKKVLQDKLKTKSEQSSTSNLNKIQQGKNDKIEENKFKSIIDTGAKYLAEKKYLSEEEAKQLLKSNEVKNMEDLTDEERKLYIQRHKDKTKQINLPSGETIETDQVKEIAPGFYTNIPDEFNTDNSISGKIGRNTQAIAGNLYLGVENGMANLMSYGTKVPKNVSEIYNKLNTAEKVALHLNPVTSITALGADLYTGTHNFAKEGKDYLPNGTRNFLENANDNFIEGLDYVKKDEQERIAKNIEDTTNSVTKKLAEMNPSIGNNAMGIAMSTINPVVGTVYFTGSAAGSYYDDAIERGMNENQAFTYGTIMGAMEGITEKVALGETTKAGMLLGKGKVKRALTQTGISVGENFVQEAIMEPIQETSAMLIGGKDKADFSNMSQRMIQSGIDGALSAIILEGATAGIQSAVDLQDKILNGKKVSQKEIQQSLSDIQKSGKVDIEEKFKQEIQYQTQKAKSTYYDYYTGEKADNNTQNILNKAENIIQRNGIQNLEQDSVKNQNNNQQQQSNQAQNKNTLNSNIEGQNNYINSAQKYNIDTNNQSVKKMEELANKRGINITFDDKFFKNNKNANAIYQTTIDKNGNVTRNIILNPNANTNRTLEQIELHEIVHDMYGTEKFNKIKDMVLEYDKGKDGYQEARTGLEELYSQVYDKNSSEFQNLVDEEAVADILGNKLGDQQFVNQLVNMKESRSVARKIYDWVVEKLNNMTRKFENMNSYFYWKDVKNKFEEAFRQEYQENSDILKYSIQMAHDGKQYVKVDTDQNIFEGKDIKEYPNIAKKYILQQYRDGSKKINLPTKENITVTSKTANEYSHPKNQLPLETKVSKMRASTELDNLTQISEYQYSKKDDGRHAIAKDGWDYYKTVFEVNGIKFEGLLNIAKSGEKRTLYDITKIKRINQNRSTSANAFSTSLVDSNNSVAQNKTKVNNNTTAQYSMQKSENNSDSFNLPKSAWQNRLDTLYKNENKGTKLQDVKLPTKENMQQNINSLQDNESGYPITKEEAFKNVINDALTNKNPKGTILLGKVKNNVAIKIKNILGIDVNNRIHSLSKTDIRHMIAQHGNQQIENNKGQIAITQEDILRIPDIINNPDKLVKGTDNKNGKTVRYIKNYGDNISFVVEVVPEKSGRMNIKTMWKKSTALTNSQMTPDSTSKTTDSSISSTTNSIPQNENNVNNKNTTTYTDTDVSGKIRKHYKSIIESNNTTQEAKAIAKELMGVDTYIPESNKVQLEQADERICKSGTDVELKSLMSRAILGEKISSVDIAVGERLMQYYSKTGEYDNLRDAMQATSMAGTTAGQTVQAMSLLNHQTPEGQLLWLQRSIEKMNNDLQRNRGKNAEQFTLTDDMIQKILNSKNQEEMYKNLNEVYDELGQQVTKTTIQKIDSWRYFSMLANPRTHIRNIVGNTAMKYTQRLKNKVAGVIESSVSVFNKDMERTHTIVPASKEVRNFAKADIKNVADRLGLNENKYNPKSRLENSMKTFKHKTLENTIGKAFELNDNLLEAEDGWGLKAGYKNALAEYMTANKLKPDTITDAQLSKARNYAVEQAKQATFHQECKLASLINQLANKNKVAKYTVDAILPFKKTPINIAKTGIEYSPVGLAKSMVYDTVQLRKGNINVNQYIDNVSKGLTGTGIALVGYALASAGILKASGSDDDKKEKYDENQGKQVYSIQIGDNTYSLDWIAPTGIPLFIGAEIYENMKSTNSVKYSKSTDENSNYNQAIKTGSNILNAMTNAMNPMAEMSMLSGLTSALSSYEQGSAQMISSIGTNAVKSYVNQFVPTALGQIAKTADPYERSTTSTKSGILPRAIDTTKNQIMNKVPGLRQKLPVKTDIWGNEIKQEENILFRGLENAILPYTRKEISTDNVDKELSRLYTISGNSSILPNSSLGKDLTFSGEKYRMTSEEYSKYKKTYGKKSHELLNNMIKSSTYSKLSDDEKEKAISKLYEYVKEYAKVEYATNNDINYKTSKMYNTVNSIEKANGNASSYFDFYARTCEIEGENASTRKIKILANANYSKKDKELIYTNYIGSEDDLYNNIMKNTGININEYLKYKQQKFTSDKKDDGTEEGKSVSGSKKAKVYDYVNKMKATGNQRLILLGTQYKLTNSERQQLSNYVQSLDITNKQKKEIYSKIKGFTVYKDGRITY